MVDRITRWLRDEEAIARAKSVAEKGLAEPPVCCSAAETVAAARAGVDAIDVDAIDDEGLG